MVKSTQRTHMRTSENARPGPLLEYGAVRSAKLQPIAALMVAYPYGRLCCSPSRALELRLHNICAMSCQKLYMSCCLKPMELLSFRHNLQCSFSATLTHHPGELGFGDMSSVRMMLWSAFERRS